MALMSADEPKCDTADVGTPWACILLALVGELLFEKAIWMEVPLSSCGLWKAEHMCNEMLIGKGSEYGINAKYWLVSC